MRTKNESIEELKNRINSGESEPKIQDIILEDEKRLLVRIMSAEKLDNKIFLTTHYQIWSNKEKFKAGIHTEAINGMQYIYCTGFAVTDEDKMIKLFQSKRQ